MDAPLEKKSQNNCIHDTMYVAVDVFAAWVWIYSYFDHAKWNEQVPFSFSFSSSLQIHLKFPIHTRIRLHLFSSAQLFSINLWGFGNIRSPLNIFSAFAEIASGNRTIKVVNSSIWLCNNNKKNEVKLKRATNMYAYTYQLCAKCYISKAKKRRNYGVWRMQEAHLHICPELNYYFPTPPPPSLSLSTTK